MTLYEIHVSVRDVTGTLQPGSRIMTRNVVLLWRILIHEGTRARDKLIYISVLNIHLGYLFAGFDDTSAIFHISMVCDAMLVYLVSVGGRYNQLVM